MRIEPNIILIIGILIILGPAFFLLGVAGKISIGGVSISLASLPSRIVIAVFGLVLLSFGIVLGIVVFKDILTPEPKPQENRKVPIVENNKTEIPPLPNDNVHQRKVMITQPRDGDFVSSEIEVSGTYSKEIKDDIWVIVWPERAQGKGWPQSNAAESGVPALKENSQWSVYCYFGGPPQRYEIVVYTATPSASKFLGSKLKEWSRTNDYKGIFVTDLPGGLVERHRILVTKRQ